MPAALKRGCFHHPGPLPGGEGGGFPLVRGDGRNMLRPYGLTRTYPSQREG